MTANCQLPADVPPPVMTNEASRDINPIQEVPATEIPPSPVVDPSAFLHSSRVINVSAYE